MTRRELKRIVNKDMSKHKKWACLVYPYTNSERPDVNYISFCDSGQEVFIHLYTIGGGRHGRVDELVSAISKEMINMNDYEYPETDPYIKTEDFVVKKLEALTDKDFPINISDYDYLDMWCREFVEFHKEK